MATDPVLGFTGHTPIVAIGTRSKIMDSGQLVWTIVIIVVALVILGLVLFFVQRRKKEKDHERAETLRQSAVDDELNARESEAKAARAAADAKQAQVDADRLQEEARSQNADAQSARSSAHEQAKRAQSLDPDAETRGSQNLDSSDARQDPIDDSNQPNRPSGTENGRANRDDGATGH
ncbi:hypothetical protein [Paeniglutamicibacter sp.]|uniref:hypothetical protein n=1 Tax=Paeniglutamicibacter sp. TaxID=1934391 RepID=UPI00398970C2